jgi:hypothetical protein
MKRAVIVVGSHYAGKSKTINKYFKRLVGITLHARKFSIGGESGRVYSQSREEVARSRGYARSQSLEESGRTAREILKLVRAYAHYNHLVFAARPQNERPSFLVPLRAALKAAGFRVFVVRVVAKQSEGFYAKRGKEILRSLSQR